ncbi:fatty acid-binding protein, liver [Folsomia candida]|uniref:fatty acid-binding protein, liver n=1 Tax=Folsomia candida TaxID=158441 RepID=UPI000B8EF92B|nr:fatty acid-binding protein, liver [Folsomia candida]
MSIIGKYDLISDPNDAEWDTYLKTVGVSDAHREAGAMVKPSIEISEAGGKYTLKTLSELKNMEISFELGKEFDETTADNRQCKTIFTKEGTSKLIQVQQLDGKKSQTVREFTAGGMNAVFSAEGVSATRKYKRVN